MKDRLDNRLLQMAQQEQLVVPEAMNRKIEDILQGLQEQKKRHCMTLRRAVVLAAALIMLCSITAAASVGILRERMEDMNREKLEEFFAQIYTSKIPADNYNRYMTDTEKERKQELQRKYEEQGLFPEGEIYLIEEPSAYKGKGVAYLPDTGTFFFPQKEMSDEELLQIIDFLYKRDYSLQKVNEMIADGKMEFPEEALKQEEEIQKTDESILGSEAVWDPSQELTIPYEGNLSITAMAAGKQFVYLGGWNAVHRMEIGGSTSELFFDGFEKETRVACLYEDADGNVYVAGAQMSAEPDSGGIEYSMPPREMRLWKLDAGGKVLQTFDLSPYASEYGGWVDRMVVDRQERIYLMGLSGERLFVLDQEGNLISEIEDKYFNLHRKGGLGLGKDGEVYTTVYRWSENIKECEMGIASIDPEKGCLKDIYSGIVPEETIMLDVIAPGAETDFVFWGYDGVFLYNLGEEAAVNILPAYEAPCGFEGVLYCALQDGRILLADSTDYVEENYGEGRTRYLRVPEKTCFYYVSGVGRK